MVDKIYYINLDQREDRRKEIEGVLVNCGVFDISERIPAIKRDVGSLGCVESHLIALSKFVESDYESVLIIEDDLMIFDEENFIKNLKTITEKNIDYDLIQISGNHIKLSECNYEGFKKVIDSQTTSGYIISKEFAPTLLNNFKESLELMKEQGRRHENCLDIYWKILQPQNKWFTFYPPLGVQRAGYSDIEGCFVDYNC